MSLRSEQGTVRSKRWSGTGVGGSREQALWSPGAWQADSPGVAVCTDELDQVLEHEL